MSRMPISNYFVLVTPSLVLVIPVWSWTRLLSCPTQWPPPRRTPPVLSCLHLLLLLLLVWMDGERYGPFDSSRAITGSKWLFIFVGAIGPSFSRRRRRLSRRRKMTTTTTRTTTKITTTTTKTTQTIQPPAKSCRYRSCVERNCGNSWNRWPPQRRGPRQR